MSYIVIDQGTSSTKAFVFSNKGEILHQKKVKYKLERPKPFHIECNPKTILDDIVYLFNEMVTKEKSENIHGLGFAFQRSTFLVVGALWGVILNIFGASGCHCPLMSLVRIKLSRNNYKYNEG